MNNCSTIRLLVLIPLLAQGAPDDSSPPSSTNRVPGVLPLILGAAVTSSCYWAYHKFSSNMKELSPEKKAEEAEINLKNCLRDYLDSSINSNGIPHQCTSFALNHALRCEKIGEESRIQIMLDSFNRRR